MSSSVDSSAIFVTDTPDKIKKKVGDLRTSVLAALTSSHTVLTVVRLVCVRSGVNQINKHAFSGGQATKELQAELGANLEVRASCPGIAAKDSS